MFRNDPWSSRLRAGTKTFRMKAPRDTLKDWWLAALAGGLLMFVVAAVAREWVLAGLAGFASFYALLIISIKSRRARGRPWS